MVSLLSWINLARLAILLLTVFLGWVTYRSHLLLKEFQPNFNLLLSPAESVVRLLLVGFCLLLAWLSSLSAAQLGFVFDDVWQSIWLGGGIGLATVLVINALTSWSIKYFGRQIYSPLLIQNILPQRPVDWALVMVAFLPAVAMEELLFRSLWIGGFREIIPLPLLILSTSIIFGLMHQPQGKLGVILAGGINVLFCVLFVWSGQLLLPLIAHYFVNILQLVVAFQQKEWLDDY